MSETVEIEDKIDDIIETTCEEVREAVIEFLDENKDEDEAPDLHGQFDYSGRFHEIIDGSVPIYTSEIDAIWFCNKYDLIAAYENAGCGENAMENDGMAAIYYLISEKVVAWYDDEKEAIFDTWKEENPDECEDEDDR